MRHLLFLVPLSIGALIQLIKVCIDTYRYKTFHRKWLRGSGGFPSVHSGLSSSIATIVALIKGTGSVEFMMILGFAFLFRYDAMHVRYEAGKHAKLINDLKHDLKQVIALDRPFNQLKERIGHTPIEVYSGVVGGVVFTLIAWHYGGLGQIFLPQITPYIPYSS